MSRKNSPIVKIQKSISLENQLREEVKRVIQSTSAGPYPAVTARLRDVEGYRQVEDAVINVVLANNITPGAALALLESEWGTI